MTHHEVRRDVPVNGSVAFWPKISIRIVATFPDDHRDQFARLLADAAQDLLHAAYGNDHEEEGPPT